MSLINDSKGICYVKYDDVPVIYKTLLVLSMYSDLFMESSFVLLFFILIIFSTFLYISSVCRLKLVGIWGWCIPGTPVCCLKILYSRADLFINFDITLHSDTLDVDSSISDHKATLVLLNFCQPLRHCSKRKV